MISTVIITWNGEETIGDCLESIAPHVDEIIIVIDTKTNDNTEEVCRHFTDKIYFREWNNNYADARNYGIERASGDWILTVDADEKLVKMPELSDDITYYWFEGSNPSPDGFNTTGKTIRLFKNNGIKYKYGTHEQLFLNGRNIAKDENLKKGYGGKIDHKEKTLEQVIEKTKGLLETALGQRKSEPDNMFLRGQIGGYYGLLGDKVKAIGFLFICILLDDVSPNSKAGGALQLSRIFDDMGEHELAEECLHLSITLCPQQLSAYAVLHESCYNRGEFEQAEHYKNLIHKVGGGSCLPFDMDINSIKFYN